MSKELTPLEAVKDLRDVKGWNETEFNKRLDIIETELKDYERLLNLRKSAEWADEKLQTKKKLKALEIIKEKEVDVSCLLFDGLEIYNENMHPSRIITQEEYDLLKEVLL